MRPTQGLRTIACAAACAGVLAVSLQSAVPSSQSAVPGSQSPAAAAPLPEQEQLRPTVHAALPKNIEDYWFAPRDAERAAGKNTALAEAAEAYASANYAASLAYARQ